MILRQRLTYLGIVSLSWTPPICTILSGVPLNVRRERKRDERERERERGEGREREGGGGGEGREIKGVEKEKNDKHLPASVCVFLYHAVLQRRPDEIDKRASDMYSFAVILWEITTGKKPYAGLSPMMAGFKVNTATSVED